ncbi:hypothetical protein KGQ20_23800 [Catenulispora sp. NF23]|uniref:Uncharacterized protein n=1 Tax=Catenulispora pinistramenti TaxID=2705254 RepID=A0ABS5L217_9ACTN|nr:hypothetical protein [Catenulispora pinistramenti]MBS2535791.1 hypothetical protein [Catenulispora pinistramenti]MBS2552272.1 hypothetical protein [Catenulispora pinistramenti]
MAAFQNYLSLENTMATKVEHSNDIVKYADGNVLTLINNYVTEERQGDFADTGTEYIKVTNVAKDTGNPPIVTITACIDDTKYYQVTTYGSRKGQVAAAAPTSPSPSIFRVHKGSDGVWRVNAVTAEVKDKC